MKQEWPTSASPIALEIIKCSRQEEEHWVQKKKDREHNRVKLILSLSTSFLMLINRAGILTGLLFCVRFATAASVAANEEAYLSEKTFSGAYRNG